MSDRSGTEGQAPPDVVDESRDHLLALSDAGWGVWEKGDPAGEPVALFPPNDEGFELASDYFKQAKRAARARRISWLGILRWSAVISGCVWILSTTVVNLRVYVLQNPFAGFQTDELLIRWSQVLSLIAYPVFIVSVGIFLLLRLRERGAS